jgi:hypothetical protein
MQLFASMHTDLISYMKFMTSTDLVDIGVHIDARFRYTNASNTNSRHVPQFYPPCSPIAVSETGNLGHTHMCLFAHCRRIHDIDRNQYG